MFLRLLFTFPSLPSDFEFLLSQHSLLLSVSGRNHLEAASIYCWHIYQRAPLCSTRCCVTTQTSNYCSSLPAQEKPNVISWFCRNCLSKKLEGILFLRSPFKCSLWDDLESLGHKGWKVLMGVGLELVPVPGRCRWTPALSWAEGRAGDGSSAAPSSQWPSAPANKWTSHSITVRYKRVLISFWSVIFNLFDAWKN